MVWNIAQKKGTEETDKTMGEDVSLKDAPHVLRGRSWIDCNMLHKCIL